MSQIPLINRPGLYVTVDLADFPWLSEFRWRLSSYGYAVRSPRRSEGFVSPTGRQDTDVAMHRQLLGLVPGDGMECDHVNGDRLDNRRLNLRAGSHADNARGFQTRRQGKSSRHRGVSRFRDRWQAQAHFEGRKRHLGTFRSQDDAAAVVNAFWVERGYAAPNVIEVAA